MKPAKKFKPGWDFASYMMRTDVEHERMPRLVESEPLDIPTRKFRMANALRAWKEIGVKNDSAWIRDHLAKLKKWQGQFDKRLSNSTRKIRIKKFNLDREA